MVQRVYEEPEFCEVLELVPLDVRQSLTFEQRAAISLAVRESRHKHSVDIRFIVPLIFTQLYFVLFIGKDRRRETEEKMVNRRNEAGRLGTAGLIAFGVMTLVVFGLVGAYVAKSRAGIDLMPNAHGTDVVKGLGIR
ncbi:MAG: hypothetical protein H7Y17_11795 [Chlorobia bacterium]|nr:hypothetical protein [Fimbriimonadaceae bacterium]